MEVLCLCISLSVVEVDGADASLVGGRGSGKVGEEVRKSARRPPTLAAVVVAGGLVGVRGGVGG